MAIIGPISVKDENATAKPSGMLCKVIATAIKIPKRIKRPREASVSPGITRSFIAEEEDNDFDNDEDIFNSLLFTFPPPPIEVEEDVFGSILFLFGSTGAVFFEQIDVR